MKIIARASCDYEDLRDHFLLANGEKTYTQQYSHIYSSRLMMLKGDLLRVARDRWPEATVLERIVGEDATPGTTEGLVAFAGTVFKEQARPDVLAEYRSEILHSDEVEEADVDQLSMIASSSSPSYEARHDDAVCVEDESGRVRISGGPLPVATAVTGICLAVCGSFDQTTGKFIASDYCGPGFAPSPSRPLPMKSTKILLLSGLRAQKLTGLLVDWLAGLALDDDDGDSSSFCCANISRCFVCGDLVDASGVESDGRGGLRDADVALARLAACVGTDALPSETDPTTSLFPQQPVHPLLLPTASRYDSFLAAPNPHQASVDGSLVLGHSGAPVHDILRHADYSAAAPSSIGESAKERNSDESDGRESRSMPDGSRFTERAGETGGDEFLSALEDTLWWRNVAPTAPDSLPCYPFKSTDPFVIDECPNVYFAGSAPAFATSLAVRPDSTTVTRIVALPSFPYTGIAAVVDLATLRIERLHFDDDCCRATTS